jgi:hypothetical protein
MVLKKDKLKLSTPFSFMENSISATEITPIAYLLSYEHPEKDDADALADLQRGLAEIRQKTNDDTGHRMRSVHVKSHGLLYGTLTVAEGMPPYLAQGLFAMAGAYPVTMRLSSSPGDMLPDSVSTPKGCALKVSGVPGTRLPGLDSDAPQNFTFGNGGKSFQSADIKSFGAGIKLLVPTVDRGIQMKVLASAVLRGVEKVIEAVGGESTTIKTLGGEPEHHILGEQWYSAVPYLYGQYIAKFALAPVSPELRTLSGTLLHAGDKPDAIREAVKAFFAAHSATWELRVQLCTDIAQMPVEDASVEWPESLSPYVTVAHVTMPPQDAWSDELAKAIDDGMSFSPWECLEAHRPLGPINRARQSVYAQSAAFRVQASDPAEIHRPSAGCPMAATPEQ